MIKYVEHLVDVERFFQEHETHMALMNDKKITVTPDMISGFHIEVEE